MRGDACHGAGLAPHDPGAGRELSNGDYLWGYTQAHREDWEMVKTMLDMGASTVRIGFEDSDMIAPGVHVDNNAALIAKVSDIAVSRHDAHDSRRGARHAQDPAVAPLKRRKRTYGDSRRYLPLRL